MQPNELFDEEHILENSRARLEPLKEHHFELLLPLAMEKELWKFTSNVISSEEDFRRYFDTALSEKESCLSYPFAVYDKQANAFAGSTRFGNISFVHKKAEIGWTWYHTAFQGTGLNKACKTLLLNFGFDVLQFNRIELKTSLLNLKSQAAMLKIGAVKEGILRNHLINDIGVVRDSVYFSFIKEEWDATKEKIFTEKY